MRLHQMTTTAILLAFVSIAWNDDSTLHASRAFQAEGVPTPPRNIETIEHRVPHVSTVPANAGEPVHLSVRERVRYQQAKHDALPVVLFIHGNTFPGVPGFDLGVPHYSWMEALAKAGFDAFTVDLTGYGFSPRPKMDDPCNADPVQQASFLIPIPLSATCAPSYPFRLATAQSEWDEIDTVVDYVRDLRGVDRIDLIGWSRGGWRAASYAARYPDKVGKLLLLGPTYNPNEPAGPPPVLPLAGFPMTIATRAATYASLWTPGIRCDGQVTAGIADEVWNTTIAFDVLGQTWGPPEGVARVRTVSYWGWNRAAASAFPPIPTLIVSGEFDTVSPNTEVLYADLAAVDKQHVLLQCASHFVPWELQAGNLHRLSIYFLNHGSIGGVHQGMWFMDIDGMLSPR